MRSPASIYEVQINGAHVKIRRRDSKPVRATWDVLQRIKNTLAGRDVTAIEVFPEQRDVVSEENIRHLFIVPRGLFPSSLHGWDDFWNKGGSEPY